MTISAAGLKMIEAHEGNGLPGKPGAAYNDSRGILTIGYGHVIKSGDPYNAGTVLSQSEMDVLLQKDIAWVNAAIQSLVKVPITQSQYDALADFIFNVGAGGFATSTVLKDLNAGDNVGAANAFMMWNKPPELLGRRNQERSAFCS
jgi:lysozyme